MSDKPNIKPLDDLKKSINGEEKKGPVFNETNFRKLIDVIDTSGRSWLDCNSDMLDDEWHTGLTHTNPDILRSFGFQCVEKADLIEAVKIVDAFKEEDKVEEISF